MSDNIPIEIQMEIIEKVYDVKSLIRFRSVSKAWKSFIDSSEFIKGYGARNTQPHSHILSYKSDCFLDEAKYICLVDDDNETFKVQQQDYKVVGACHELLCLYGFHLDYEEWVLLIWNPSIGKSFGIAASKIYNQADNYWTDYRFGVCPVTKDPTIVKIQHRIGMPWHVEVFTLSSRVWNVIPSGNLPHESIGLDSKTHIVIDRFIYWGAYEETFDDDGEATINHILVSFDLITKEFKVAELPRNLRNELGGRPVAVANLRESLVVYGSIYVDGAECCHVWVMERDSSFRKLFTIGERVSKILGFGKSGEPIFEIRKEGVSLTTLDVYNPCSQQFKNLGISGVEGSFFMCSYKESLLLLDHSESDFHIH
ncbi:probable galacturonosyltransferase 7 isoform X2 [Tanacetum coccineum]